MLELEIVGSSPLPAEEIERLAALAARGVRFDDPAFRIEWPLDPVVVSARDLAFPPYVD